MPDKLTKEEYDAFATAPAETTEPRDHEAWKEAPDGVVEEGTDDDSRRERG
ncbi:MAG TPA: hypothetical protein VHN98_11220 [Acidimicrobiales bacterium]|nr:hypothetical protein [Acidimicrobiales bacterium]